VIRSTLPGPSVSSVAPDEIGDAVPIEVTDDGKLPAGVGDSREARNRINVRIIAFITEPPAIRAILTHLGEPIAPRTVAPTRGPSLWELALESVPVCGDTPHPTPACDFDQRQHW
jgi:hypothetical protein